MEMDTKGFRSREERTVTLAKHYAGVLPLANAQQYGALLCSDSLGIFCALPRKADSVSGLSRKAVLAFGALVMAHMLFLRYPFQIASVVVCFVAILVVYASGGVWFSNPADSNHAMQETFPNRDVPVISFLGFIPGRELSKNFPATGNGIDVVEESVLDSVHLDAKNVGQLALLSMVRTARFYHKEK